MNTNEQTRDFQVDVAPRFDKALLNLNQDKLEPYKWDMVMDLYESGRYKDAIIGILDYVDPELVKKRGNVNKTEFIIPHGSIIVKLKIDDQKLTVTAPFLYIPPTGNVALLRQASQINLYPLNLSILNLENNQLIFKYTCPLDLCEPYKIYDVFKEICIYADSYDDEFIKKFGAQWIKTPIIKKLPLKYIDDAWHKFQDYINEAIRYIDFFEGKRLFGFCFDIINITLMKIDYYLSPQGVLRTDIEKELSLLQAQDVQLPDKVRKGKAFLNYLVNYDRNEFSKDLYVAQTFIPFKAVASLENIKANFQGYYDTAKKEIDGRDYMGSVLTILTAFFNLYYHNLFPEDITGIITDALIRSSNKPWSKASSYLWIAMDTIMNSRKPKKKSRGFLSAIFGN